MPLGKSNWAARSESAKESVEQLLVLDAVLAWLSGEGAHTREAKKAEAEEGERGRFGNLSDVQRQVIDTDGLRWMT